MINGAYLKQLRRDRRLTLASLSEQINCTASYLSQIERGLKEPSLTMLRKLSDCLNEPIFSFLSPDAAPVSPQSSTSYSIVRANSRRVVEIPELTLKSETITAAAGRNGARPMHGVIYTMTSGTFSSEGLIKHTFDECTFVLSGEITVFFDEKAETIKQGDCIYIDAFTNHNFQSCGVDDAVMLVFNN